MNSPPLISVIIVSFNTRELTLRSLAALYADMGDTAAEVFVVDNKSCDGSVEAIRKEYPGVVLIENSRNLGFGAANNIAMGRAQGEFFLLLNSDAFVHRGAVAALIAHGRAHPECGVIGPKILCPDGSRQLSCFRFTTPARAWFENLWLSQLLSHHPIIGDYRRWAHDSDRIVDFVIGACMLVRAEVYREVGGFDESFFMYSEESDWQYRMAKAGWKVAFTPAAVVTHVGGASGVGEKARINRHFFDSLDRYVKKHHGVAGLLSLRTAMAIGCGIRTGLWGAAYLFSPRRRPLAAAKTRLLSWLVIRQLTFWRPLFGDGLNQQFEIR